MKEIRWSRVFFVLAAVFTLILFHPLLLAAGKHTHGITTLEKRIGTLKERTQPPTIEERINPRFDSPRARDQSW